MDNIKYPIFEDRDALMFEFVSEGPYGRVEKKVIYHKTEIPDLYILGFGDKGENEGSIDDLIVTNNGDTKKVLATVASTLYVFTSWFPNAIVMAEGSTKSRNRLYRMSISNNYDLIQENFEIFGYKNDTWHSFEKNTDYEEFFAKRKFINLTL